MSEWKEVELSELINFGNGKKKPESEGNIPIYGGNGILGFSADSNYENETIIIGRVGAYCGSVYYENKPIWVSDNALAAKAKNGNSTKFLYYFLKNANLNQHAGGSSHPLVTQTLLNSLKYEVCIDEVEQNSIAEVLSSLDDKIDLLHRQNQTLEEMAETLFRQWFVEEADDGWEEGVLGDLVEVKYGKDHKKLLDGVIPVYGSGGLMRNAEKSLYEGESVLIPRKGTLNNVMYVNEAFWTVDTMFYTIMKREHLAKFVYQFIKQKDLASMNVGSAVPSMTTAVLNNMPIEIPTDDLLERFDKIVSEFYDRIKSNQTQIRTLTASRDTLLPKLMSGEVKVKSN